MRHDIHVLTRENEMLAFFTAHRLGDGEDLETLIAAGYDLTQAGSGEEDEEGSSSSSSSSSRASASVRLTQAQLLEVARGCREDIKADAALAKERSLGALSTLQVVVTQAGLRLDALKALAHEFNTAVVVRGKNPRTGTIMSEAVVKFFEDSLRKRRQRAEKLTWKAGVLQRQLESLRRSSKAASDSSSELVRYITFHQLRIENAQFTSRLAEKNREVLKLKMITGITSDVVTQLKGEWGGLAPAGLRSCCPSLSLSLTHTHTHTLTHLPAHHTHAHTHCPACPLPGELSRASKSILDLRAAIKDRSQQLQKVATLQAELDKQVGGLRRELQLNEQRSQDASGMPTVLDYINLVRTDRLLKAEVAQAVRKAEVGAGVSPGRSAGSRGQGGRSASAGSAFSSGGGLERLGEDSLRAPSSSSSSSSSSASAAALANPAFTASASLSATGLGGTGLGSSCTLPSVAGTRPMGTVSSVNRVLYKSVGTGSCAPAPSALRRAMPAKVAVETAEAMGGRALGGGGAGGASAAQRHRGRGAAAGRGGVWGHAGQQHGQHWGRGRGRGRGGACSVQAAPGQGWSQGAAAQRGWQGRGGRVRQQPANSNRGL